MKLLKVLTWILCLVFSKASDQICVSKNGDICLPKDYDRLTRPYLDKPIEVRVDLDVLQVLEINDIEFTLSFSMYFGVRWEEPRLIANSSNEIYVPVDISFFDELWVPDVYIYHLKQIRRYKIFTDFAGLFVVNSSTILYSHEVHVTIYCPMRYEKYPLDTQLCPFHIGSYAFDMKSMVFNNEVLQYDNSRKNTILDYHVEIIPLNEAERIYYWLDIGNYSLTGFQLKLTRNHMKYLLNYFLPSGLFVVVSWSSFLIPPEIVPGRMTLLVTLFLVLINIFNNITTQSPNTDTMTSVSAWMLSCIMFVFGALAAYAVLLFFKYIKVKKGQIGPSMTPNTTENNLRIFDLFCLFAFPTLFLVFNLFFWALYFENE